jgi:cellulose synthase/poly-beta-1,6-N-acetylglucosamine synthase-like glycosyltransferase
MPPLLDVVAQGLLVGLALCVSVATVYYVMLAAAYLLLPRRPAPSAARQTRFAVVIPAHDEEMVLPTALGSWSAQDYPRESFTVFVVADNCRDQTAALARQLGVHCLERTDPTRRGKGQALAWAFAQIPLGEYDAIVVADADCAINPPFLHLMNARLAAGAQVVQGFDGILNPDASMLTRLMQITNVMKNQLFMHAKSKLGLSAQLMGTGMCFDRLLLQQAGWSAYSVGEDIEQSARLTERGVVVAFEPDAVVQAQEATSFKQAYSQRVRWASSRMSLFRTGWRLILQGVRRASLQWVDAGLSLVVPNYALLANLSLLGLGVAVLVGAPTYILAWFGATLTLLIAYFAVGIALSGLTRRSLLSLSLAPVFLGWKVFVDLVALVRGRNLPWVRTRRLSEVRRDT